MLEPGIFNFPYQNNSNMNIDQVPKTLLSLQKNRNPRIGFYIRQVRDKLVIFPPVIVVEKINRLWCSSVFVLKLFYVLNEFVQLSKFRISFFSPVHAPIILVSNTTFLVSHNTSLFITTYDVRILAECRTLVTYKLS